MARLVDLTAPPFQLSPHQLDWVGQTLASLSIKEKVGQLFFAMFNSGSEPSGGNALTARQLLDRFHIGGARYRGGTARQVQDLINGLQAASRLPLLVAANCDSGGDGACSDGTYIASGAQAEASRDPAIAHSAGWVAAREAAALGVNLNFDPCVDILFNWRNTIVNTRAYGATADDVIRYTHAYRQGVSDAGGLLQCVKHFPGDGVEERDQHLVLGVNDLTPEAWDASFGRVYRHHIQTGADMIMAGHIALPLYQKRLRPSLADRDILPASLAEELLVDLLREQLGFNGVIVTDASHMVGLAASMRREEYVPRAIAAGCDMFLFFNDAEEDFQFMLNGCRNGAITAERLDDAVRRILGLKSKLGLPEARDNGALLKPESALAGVGCPDHLARRAEAADRAITRVKNTLGQLPIRPETHRRIRLVYLQGEAGGMAHAAPGVRDNILAELTRRGFEVTLNDGSTRVKGPTLRYRQEADAVLIFADIAGYGAENNYRIRWKTPMSTDCPWYVHEVPTVFVSLNYTTHLHDVSMVKCLINAYHNNPDTIRLVIDKIMGESPFTGIPNETVWAGKWQARL